MEMLESKINFISTQDEEIDGLMAVEYLKNKMEELKNKEFDGELSGENLERALYLLNKSIKKSRDSKRRSYKLHDYYNVNKEKLRQNNLYGLKKRIVDLMEREGLLTLRGYNIQRFRTGIQVLKLYTGNSLGFKFHMPSSLTEVEVLHLDRLDDIEGEITSVTCDVGLNYKDGFGLLMNFQEIEEGKVRA